MWECQPSLKPRSTAYLAALATLIVSAPVHADGRVWAGPTIANLTTLSSGGVLGVGGQIGAGIGVTDFLSVTLDFIASHHFARPEADLPGDRVLGAGLGIRYDFDVFSYVPYAGIGVTGYLDNPLATDPPLYTSAGAKLFLGIDWRFHRRWSAGFHAELHAFLSDISRLPIYNFALLNIAHHFRL